MGITKSSGKLAKDYLFNPMNRFLDSPVKNKRLVKWVEKYNTIEVDEGEYSFNFLLKLESMLLNRGYQISKAKFRSLLRFYMDQLVVDSSLLGNNGFYRFLLGEDLRKEIYELNQKTLDKKLDFFNKFKKKLQKERDDILWYELRTKYVLRFFERNMPTLERELMKLGQLTWDDTKRMDEIIGSEGEELGGREGRNIRLKIEIIFLVLI